MFWTLVALVVLAPLALGAVYAWTWGLMGAAVGGLLLAWGAMSLLSREAPPVSAAAVWPILLCFGLAAGWAALQASTLLPEGWAHPLWAEAAAALGVEVAPRVSVDPHETGSALARLLTYGGIFWLALQWGRERRRARQGVYAVALAGFVYAAYGLAVEFSGAGTVLWFEKTVYVDNLTGVFVNRNSYATYAGLGLLAVTALLVQLVAETYGVDGSIRRERLLLLLTRLGESGWILLLGWVVLGTALVLTDSRAGVVTAWLGLLALFAAVAVSRTIRRRHAAAMGGAVLAAGLGVLVLSGDQLSDRLARVAEDSAGRAHVYALTADAVSDAPLLGTGYGTFPEVFRMYRDEALRVRFVKAHSTYLENALELGLPAAAALVLAVVAAAGYCLAGLRRRRRDAVYPALGLAATVAVAAHSLVDFSLQIPAVAATYVFLLGIGCAQSWSSRRARV